MVYKFVACVSGKHPEGSRLLPRADALRRGHGACAPRWRAQGNPVIRVISLGPGQSAVCAVSLVVASFLVKVGRSSAACDPAPSLLMPGSPVPPLAAMRKHPANVAPDRLMVDGPGRHALSHGVRRNIPSLYLHAQVPAAAKRARQ